MGEPAELTATERAKVLALASKIVEGVTDDTISSPYSALLAHAHLQFGELPRDVLDWIILAMSQEILRLKAAQCSEDAT